MRYIQVERCAKCRYTEWKLPIPWSRWREYLYRLFVASRELVTMNRDDHHANTRYDYTNGMNYYLLGYIWYLVSTQNLYNLYIFISQYYVCNTVGIFSSTDYVLCFEISGLIFFFTCTIIFSQFLTPFLIPWSRIGSSSSWKLKFFRVRVHLVITFFDQYLQVIKFNLF